MKKIMLLLFFILVSCDKNQKYKVIQIVEEEELNGKIIRKEKIKLEDYENDSIASIMTYRSYCLSKKLDKDFAEKKIKDYSKTIDFKLLNNNDQPIIIDKYLTKTQKNKIYSEYFKDENIFDSPKTYTKEEIDSQFSTYDGHHIKLEEYVLSRMNNPESYKHISSEYKERDGYLEVILTFSGTNSYNAIVINKVQAKCDLSSGNVIEVINKQ